jgi:NitT/TauT family transport system substrate-binding protein
VELYGNVLMVSPKFATDQPEGVRRFHPCAHQGLRDTIKDPTAATASVIKRNDVAKPDLEKEHLELSLAQKLRDALGQGQRLRQHRQGTFRRAIDQIGLTFNFKAKPKVEDIFTEGIPAAARGSQGRLKMECIMRDLHAWRRVTIMLLTHDLREAVFLADRTSA